MRISDWSSDVCSSDLVKIFGKPLHRINSLIGGLADQVPRHKNIRSHAICLNLHGAAQFAAIHGVVCYAVTNQIAVKSEEIGRAHVCTPVTNAPLVCRLLLEKNTRRASLARRRVRGAYRAAGE